MFLLQLPYFLIIFKNFSFISSPKILLLSIFIPTQRFQSNNTLLSFQNELFRKLKVYYRFDISGIPSMSKNFCLWKKTKISLLRFKGICVKTCASRGFFVELFHKISHFVFLLGLFVPWWILGKQNWDIPTSKDSKASRILRCGAWEENFDPL